MRLTTECPIICFEKKFCIKAYLTKHVIKVELSWYSNRNTVNRYKYDNTLEDLSVIWILWNTSVVRKRRNFSIKPTVSKSADTNWNILHETGVQIIRFHWNLKQTLNCATRTVISFCSRNVVENRLLCNWICTTWNNFVANAHYALRYLFLLISGIYFGNYCHLHYYYFR